MDFNQLFDTSILFGANKLILLENIVEILEKFQKLNISYTYCAFILYNAHSNNTRLLALNILETFFKEQWNYLRKTIIDILIKNQNIKDDTIKEYTKDFIPSMIYFYLD